MKLFECEPPGLTRVVLSMNHLNISVWANWSSWSDCTFTKDCGVAVKTRKRRCPLDEETAKDTDVNGQSESSCKGFPEESLLCDVLSCDGRCLRDFLLGRS